MKIKFLSLAMVLAFSGWASADIINQKDSADFDYLYEQDVDSSSQDLDTNAVSDFFTGNAAEHPSIGGGLATFSDGDFYRSDFGGSITRAQFANGVDTFTVEIRARMLTTGSADGSRGTMGMFWRGGGQFASLYVGDNSVYDSNGNLIDSSDNTDGFHVYRLAKDADGDYSFWRDGVLLLQNQAGVANGGANGLFMGDTGGTNSGDWEMDYMRIAKGGFAPVPEPASATLGLLMLAGLAIRQRRK